MKKFNTRSFVSLSLLFWTAALLVNSIVLYVAPPGRDAHWVNWTFWGLDKDQWGAFHTIGGFLFIVFGIWHIALNIRPMLAYLSSKAESAVKNRSELAAALFFFALVSAGSIKDVPPFAQFMAYGSTLKEGWVPNAEKPEVAHGELLKLEELSKQLGREYEEVLAKAAAAGLKIEEDKIVQYNADKNGLSPAELYLLLFGERKTGQDTSRPGEGGGYGRKTVKGLCSEFSVPLETGLARLEEKGCRAKGDSNLREIASSCGLTPLEAAGLIKGEK